MTVDVLPRVALVTTCHNRREKSVATIGEFLRQSEGVFDVRVYATDDGCTDGTGRALESLGPVQVIAGDGQLFWAGGMRAASARALQEQHDWVVWINDDVSLPESALKSFASQIRELGTSAMSSVFVGSVFDSSGSSLAYGRRVQHRRNPISFALIESNGDRADTMNGNLVFFPSGLYSALGGFPSKYQHGYADYVMGLRASRAGYSILSLTGPAGVDSGGLKHSPMFDAQAPLIDRLNAVRSPFGLPFADHARFCREVAGPLYGLVLFLRSYGRVIFPARGTGER